VFIFTVSLLKDGDCSVTRSTLSRDADAPVVVRRADLENYFKGSVLIRGKWVGITAGTLVGAWNDLDRVGIVELTVME
jgi:hypothetical protein